MRLPPRLLSPSPSISCTLSFPPPLSHTLSISSLPILVHISLCDFVRLPFPLFFSFASFSSSLFKAPMFLLLLPPSLLFFIPPLFALQMLGELRACRSICLALNGTSSGPNDLFLTMGPNGPQIINDEGSMERWATERVTEGERGGGLPLRLHFLVLHTSFLDFNIHFDLHSFHSLFQVSS